MKSEYQKSKKKIEKINTNRFYVVCQYNSIENGLLKRFVSQLPAQWEGLLRLFVFVMKY